MNSAKLNINDYSTDYQFEYNVSTQNKIKYKIIFFSFLISIPLMLLLLFIFPSVGALIFMIWFASYFLLILINKRPKCPKCKKRMQKIELLEKNGDGSIFYICKKCKLKICSGITTTSG